MEHYTSTDRPFGHEMVLYSMLTVEDPKEYPWNQYYLKHKELYPGHLVPECLKGSDNEEDGATSPIKDKEVNDSDESDMSDSDGTDE